jgi:hypothetical protein
LFRGRFLAQFAPSWQSTLVASGQRKRLRSAQMHPSEMMTIVILFQQSQYRTFKAYYTQYVHCHLRSELPALVSYQCFVELMPTLLVPLVVYLHAQLGHCSGISFIDSTSLAVCHPARIHQHRVFAGRAARGKTSVGWFYGFKLHLVVNDQDELLAYCLTPGNVDDRRPVPKLAKRLFGKLFSDKGYLSQPHQPGRWAYCLLLSAQETVARATAFRSEAGLTYPELTLILKSAMLLSRIPWLQILGKRV